MGNRERKKTNLAGVTRGGEQWLGLKRVGYGFPILVEPARTL